mgnify:CR=1 FL=1
MPQQYTKEQIDKILKQLPEELHEAVFSMETANAIWTTCTKQNIIDERLSKIAEYTGYVLMGLIFPQEFEQTLIKEIKLPKKVAQEVAHEINRFVFYPVRPALEQLHGTQVATTPKTATAKKSLSQEVAPQEQEPSKEPQSQEQPQQQPQGPDTYRESIDENE